MADQDDVCVALKGLITPLVYPNGTAAASIVGSAVKIFQGWPVAAQLDEDMAAGICNVSVYPNAQEKNTTRFPKRWHKVSQNTATLALTISGQTVTVSGTPPTVTNPQNVMMGVNGAPYVYPATPTDTLASIATALAALVAVGVPGTTAAGAVITLPPTARIDAARIGITGQVARELGRQEKLFQIGIWCPNPTLRTALAKAIQPSLMKTERIVMPDSFWARLIYQKSLEIDAYQKQAIYRRDIFCTVEFATTEVDTAYTVTVVDVVVNGTPVITLE